VGLGADYFLDVLNFQNPHLRMGYEDLDKIRGGFLLCIFFFAIFYTSGCAGGDSTAEVQISVTARCVRCATNGTWPAQLM
jgi:hypothetical protein